MCRAVCHTSYGSRVLAHRRHLARREVDLVDHPVHSRSVCLIVVVAKAHVHYRSSMLIRVGQARFRLGDIVAVELLVP